MRLGLFAAILAPLAAGAVACSAVIGIPDRELAQDDAGDAWGDDAAASDDAYEASPPRTDDAGADVIVQASDAGAPPLDDGAFLAAVRDGDGVTVLAVATDGSLRRASGQAGHAWDRATIGGPGLAPSGAPIATAITKGAVARAFVAGRDGAIYATERGDAGGWIAPRAVTAPAATAPGAHLAAMTRGDGVALFYVDTHGALVQTAIGAVDARAAHPTSLGSAGLAPPGAPVAAASLTAGTIDVILVDARGALTAVHWTDEAGAWSPPTEITTAQWAPAGAFVALQPQIATQLDAFAVDATGTPTVSWTSGDGRWSGPVPLETRGGIAPPGAPLFLAPQGATQLDLFVVDDTGALDVLLVQGGAPWTGPLPMSAAGFARPGAPIAASAEDARVLDAFVSATGTAWITWEVDDGAWGAPTRIF